MRSLAAIMAVALAPADRGRRAGGYGDAGHRAGPRPGHTAATPERRRRLRGAFLAAMDAMLERRGPRRPLMGFAEQSWDDPGRKWVTHPARALTC